jgi:hypothetical protein
MIRGNVIALEPQRKCESCGLHWNRLFDVFVNGRGWVKRCGKCADGRPAGAPTAYTGPYLIRTNGSGVEA